MNLFPISFADIYGVDHPDAVAMIASASQQASISISEDGTENVGYAALNYQVRFWHSEAERAAGAPAQFYTTGTPYAGAVTAPDFIISSDINLKSGLTKIDNALSKICAITGYEYEKIVDPANPSIKKREVGIIAQDVQKIEPSAVSELEFNTGDKYLGVSPTAIIALLIESVKDLKAQVDELKNNLIWSNK